MVVERNNTVRFRAGNANAAPWSIPSHLRDEYVPLLFYFYFVLADDSGGFPANCATCSVLIP